MIARDEYTGLKNNSYLHQELHDKKVLHYFKNVNQIYEIGPVLLVKKNASMNIISQMTGNKVLTSLHFLIIWNPFLPVLKMASKQKNHKAKFHTSWKQLYVSNMKTSFLFHDMKPRIRQQKAVKIQVVLSK